jgi:hypothetical protein
MKKGIPFVPRHCEKRSDAAILHATVGLLEMPQQIAKLQLDCHVPCGARNDGRGRSVPH